MLMLSRWNIFTTACIWIANFAKYTYQPSVRVRGCVVWCFRHTNTDRHIQIFLLSSHTRFVSFHCIIAHPYIIPRDVKFKFNWRCFWSFVNSRGTNFETMRRMLKFFLQIWQTSWLTSTVPANSWIVRRRSSWKSFQIYSKFFFFPPFWSPWTSVFSTDTMLALKREYH
jgi:hypothetical protein